MSVPTELLRQVDAVAKAEGRTRSELFREAVRQFIADRAPPRKSARSVLLRLAALASDGPNVPACTLERRIYTRKRGS